jgi:hypothetical protein
MGQETVPSACRRFARSMIGGARFAIAKSAKGFKPFVEKDTQPLVQLGEIHP